MTTTLATLPEAPLVERLGGQVRLLPYLEDFSTSGILARLAEPPRIRTSPGIWGPK